VAKWRAARPTELQRACTPAPAAGREQIDVLFMANNNDHYLCVSSIERNMKTAVPRSLRLRRLSDRAKRSRRLAAPICRSDQQARRRRELMQAWTRADLAPALGTFTLMLIFVSALLKKIRICATMPSSGLCPMRLTG
jgi:hypothetical protein